jgi:N-acetylneuraminic acid mutarotase
MQTAAYFIAVGCALGGPDASEAWIDLPALPTPRQEVAVAAVSGVVYVIGGITEDRRPSAVVEAYDPASRSWRRAADLPRALHHVGAAASGGRLYTFGGLDASFAAVADCFVYAPESDAWTPIAPLPAARGAAGVAELGGKIYVAGGQGANGSVRDFTAFTPDPEGEGSWAVLPPMPTPRNHLAAAALDGRFFAISGRAGGLRPELEAFDPSAGAWTPLAPIPTPRGGIAAAAVSRGIYVFGGEGNDDDPTGVFQNVERYDVDSDAWSPRLDMSAPRHGIGAARVGDSIFIPGGSFVEGFGVTAVSTAYLPPAVDLPHFTRGDADGNGSVDLADAVRILFRLYAGGAPFECDDAADADNLGSIELPDALRILYYLFTDAEPLDAPVAGEAGDSRPDLLGCGS